MDSVIDNIIFYDGECGLCNFFVRFIFRHSPKGAFYFAPLEGNTAQSHHIIKKGDTDWNSVIFKKNGSLYYESDAVLEIFKNANTPWKWFYHFKFIPSTWRNKIYKWIAKNRKFLWQKNHCQIPNSAEKKFFLR